MKHIVGIRREDKNEWEKRTPLVPKDVKYLIENFDLDIYIQPSDIRVYSNGEYKEAGATVTEDLSPCEVIFGVKEMPIDFIQPAGTYVFFSHTLKGQYYNMPLLKRFIEKKSNLIDYEGITDENNRRLIFFGKHAGLAGMIETIWALGEKLKIDGLETPFYEMRQTYKYRHLKAAKEDLKIISEQISEKGFPESIVPVVFGITGYGNVSKGSQEILDLLPVIEITPKELLAMEKSNDFSSHHIYKVVFKEEDMFVPVDSNRTFDLYDYFKNPKNYKSIFHTYLPFLTVLVNAIFWADKYPRLVTREATYLLEKYHRTKLKVIGDISCDINGAIEMNTHETDPGQPVYIFDPISGNTKNGFEGEGIVIMAVDNLPCELPKESSIFFSEVLKEYVHPIVLCNYEQEYEKLEIPDEIKKALIVQRGKLTDKYAYLKEFVEI